MDFKQKAEQWITCRDPRVKRIHLSHTDMDGYGCQVVTQVTRCICALKGIVTQPIIYQNMGCDLNSQRAAIESAVREAEDDGYGDKSNTILSFLVTDISRFNPQTVFADLIERGYTVHWLILDHHQDMDKLSQIPESEVTLPSSNLKLYTGIKIDTNQSAALGLYKEMVQPIVSETESYRSDLIMLGVEEQIKLVNNVLYDLCFYTSLSDTGHLGEWAEKIDLDYCPVEQLKYRLFFEWYWDTRDAERWVTDWTQYCIGDTMLSPTGIFSNYFNRCFQKRVFEYWRKLTSCYCMATSALTPYAGPFDLATNKFGSEYTVFELIPDRTVYMGKLFSPVSAELLRVRPDIDILAIHYPESRTISLRTAKGDINVAEIAARYGGGGHPKASGFHYR